jgi:hypothetical protein
VNPADLTALSAEQLLAEHVADAIVAWECRRRTGHESLPSSREKALRAELLRRLAVHDRQRCGPPDPA